MNGGENGLAAKLGDPGFILKRRRSGPVANAAGDQIESLPPRK